MTKENYDTNVIDDFGDEWDAYDQSEVDADELEKQFLDYFSLTGLGELPNLPEQHNEKIDQLLNDPSVREPSE